MNADYGLIGKQISFYRHQVGLTQEQLAEARNLSISYLNRIENGRKKASLDVLITIADTLGTTMDNLLSGNQQNDRLDCYDDMARMKKAIRCPGKQHIRLNGRISSVFLYLSIRTSCR